VTELSLLPHIINQIYSWYSSQN